MTRASVPEAPGKSCISCVKDRPLSARSTACCCSTTKPALASVACSSGARPPVTVIGCDVDPTPSCASARAVWSTTNWMPVTSLGQNPSATTSTLQLFQNVKPPVRSHAPLRRVCHVQVIDRAVAILDRLLKSDGGLLSGINSFRTYRPALPVSNRCFALAGLAILRFFPGALPWTEMLWPLRGKGTFVGASNLPQSPLNGFEYPVY